MERRAIFVMFLLGLMGLIGTTLLMLSDSPVEDGMPRQLHGGGWRRGGPHKGIGKPGHFDHPNHGPKHHPWGHYGRDEPRPVPPYDPGYLPEKREFKPDLSDQELKKTGDVTDTEPLENAISEPEIEVAEIEISEPETTQTEEKVKETSPTSETKEIKQEAKEERHSRAVERRRHHRKDKNKHRHRDEDRDDEDEYEDEHRSIARVIVPAVVIGFAIVGVVSCLRFAWNRANNSQNIPQHQVHDYRPQYNERSQYVQPVVGIPVQAPNMYPDLRPQAPPQNY